MIQLFLVLLLPVIGFLIFRAVMRSHLFNRLCTSAFGPDDDSDVLQTLEHVEQQAIDRANEAEKVAARKRRNAEAIRTRIKS